MSKYNIFINELKEAIRDAGRDERDIRLIAASKYFSTDEITKMHNMGQSAFGENRLQDAILKIDCLREKDIEWHFFGHVQTNKAKKIVQYFSVIHSLDSLRVAEMLEKHASEINKILRVFIQVNLAGEETKTGYDKKVLISEFQSLMNLPHLKFEGLMTITPNFTNSSDARPLFRELRILQDEINRKFAADLTSLSMGMTQDYKYALMEGATHLRIGSALK